MASTASRLERRQVTTGPADVDVSGLKRALERAVTGEVRFDAGTRAMYANDFSIYRAVPIGVVIPRGPEDVIAGVGGGATASASTASSTGSASSSTGGGGACHVDADCPAAPSACHAYACAPGGTCVLGQLADTTPCDDGLYCSVGDACQAGACVGLPRSCPAKDA